MKLYPLLRPLLFKLPPETAHRLAVRALAYNLVPPQPEVQHPSLAVKISGLAFPHPVGLAAGFDKNAEAVENLFHQGFSSVECGTVTLRPQTGNPKPRLFRLAEDQAIINRMGFNNQGLDALLKQLQHRPRARGIVGVNIGRNKDSEDAVSDYVRLLEAVADYADYVTINISSPNTPGLRDLQTGSALNELLEALCKTRQNLPRFLPLWLKLAPDLTDAQCTSIAQTVKSYPVDALIIGNTTVSRDFPLAGLHKNEQGGLSGRPLMALSTDRLALFYRLTEGKIPLIGVGGIASAEDAYAKIRAGASLVQLYSALVFKGFDLVSEIKNGLISLLRRDGFDSLSQAIGIDASSKTPLQS